MKEGEPFVPWAKLRKATVMAAYPRAWDEEDRPHQILYGAYDIAQEFGYQPATARQWLTNYRLPLADGPDINGYPTWTRGTVLAWLYLQHRLPANLIGEAQTFLSSAEGKVVLERLAALLFPEE